MPGIKHATKKRFAKASTLKSTISKGISAEYVAYRSKLDKILTAVKSLIKQIQASSTVWVSVAKHQNNFANALLAALPTDGPVRNHAREVENNLRQLQRLMLDDDAANTPHKQITAILDAYVVHIQNVQKDYAAVETSYTEVTRYQKKVDKLTKKGQKKHQALQRNMDKLTSARAHHEKTLSHTLQRMKHVYDKHEAVFQCAHHAFWIAQEKYSRVLNDSTRNIRWESMAFRQHLVAIDIHAAQQLPPLPRVHLLPPPPAEVVEYPTLELDAAVPPQHNHVDDLVVPVPIVTSPSTKHANTPAPASDPKLDKGAADHVDVTSKIPALPTDKPVAPAIKPAPEARKTALVAS